MIRINLLSTAKPKKGKRSRKLFALPRLTTDGPSPLMAGLAIFVATGAGLYWYYMHLENTHEKLQAGIAEANRTITSMSKVKQAFLERQKEYDAFKRRFDVIDQLRAGQSGPVDLLNKLGATVNQTDGVWLVSMKDEGASVSLDGVALGPKAVANLMVNLKRSGYFRNVELKDTVQDDNQKVQTFTFSLVCEKMKA